MSINKHLVYKQTSKNLMSNGIFLSFLCIFIIIASRKLEHLSVPYLWAEDAAVFLQRSIDLGVRSLVVPYAGYLHFIPQIVTYILLKICIVIGVGIEPVPYLMNYSAIALSAGMLCYFVSDHFTWFLKNKKARLIFIILIISTIPSNTAEVWLTITNFQWWSGLFIFFVGLEIVYKDELPKSSIMNIILFFLGLSTTLVCLIISCYLYIILKKFIIYRNKNISEFVTENKCDFHKLFFVASPLIIQIAFFLSSDRVSISNISIWLYKLKLLIELMFGRVAIFNPEQPLPNELANICLGISIWLIFYLASRNKKIVLYSFLFVLVNYFLTCMLFDQASGEAVLANGGGRYHFIPQTILRIQMVHILYEKFHFSKKEIYRSISFLLGLILFVNNIPKFSLHTHNLQGTEYYKSVAKYFNVESQERILVPTPLSDWFLRLPFYIGATKTEHITSFSIDLIGTNSTHEQPIIIKHTSNEVIGWAVDERNKDTVDNVIIKINDSYFSSKKSGGYNLIDYFGNPNYKSVGFTSVVPKEYFLVGENKWEIIMIGNGSYEYYIMPFSFYVDKIE